MVSTTVENSNFRVYCVLAVRSNRPLIRSGWKMFSRVPCTITLNGPFLTNREKTSSNNMVIAPTRTRITTAAQHIHAANTGQEGAKLEPTTCPVFRKLFWDIWLGPVND